LRIKQVKLLTLVLLFLLTPGALRAQDGGSVVRLDPALDQIVSSDAQVQQAAKGFLFLEGPVWIRKAGYLIFSDIPFNTIDKWTPGGSATRFLDNSGFSGVAASGVGKQQTNGVDTFGNLGSNGITLDGQGRPVFCAMGDRQVVRLEKNNHRTVLADRYEGKLLNSGCNDLVTKSDGALYFTDPPSGLRDGDKDRAKELPYDGVFMLKSGRLTLIIEDLANPNGLAFSPDEKFLYVDDTTNRTVMRYEVQPDGTVKNGEVFADMTGDKATGNPDGIKVDTKGNVYCAGAGGIWIIAPEGRHIGTLRFPEQPSNLTFGDADGKTLYVTARRGLYRIRLNVAGIRP
jgi:gluconolactonase